MRLLDVSTREPPSPGGDRITQPSPSREHSIASSRQRLDRLLR